jgi:hypothetical protein
MADTTYRIGLLLVVFCGFLASNSSGAPAGLAVWGMGVGLFVGALGAVRDGLRGRESSRSR